MTNAEINQIVATDRYNQNRDLKYHYLGYIILEGVGIYQQHIVSILK